MLGLCQRLGAETSSISGDGRCRPTALKPRNRSSNRGPRPGPVLVDPSRGASRRQPGRAPPGPSLRHRLRVRRHQPALLVLRLHHGGQWSFRSMLAIKRSRHRSTGLEFLRARAALFTAARRRRYGNRPDLFLRHRFLWWPLHYDRVSGRRHLHDVLRLVRACSSAWLLKLVILRYGGSRLYLRLRPFFLGMVLGNIVCAGFWMAVTMITGTRAPVPL